MIFLKFYTKWGEFSVPIHTSSILNTASVPVLNIQEEALDTTLLDSTQTALNSWNEQQDTEGYTYSGEPAISSTLIKEEEALL